MLTDGIEEEDYEERSDESDDSDDSDKDDIFKLLSMNSDKYIEALHL